LHCTKMSSDQFAMQKYSLRALNGLATALP
jgi:hypothetical protein